MVFRYLLRDPGVSWSSMTVKSNVEHQKCEKCKKCAPQEKQKMHKNADSQH